MAPFLSQVTLLTTMSLLVPLSQDPKEEDGLERQLQQMLWYHDFSLSEMSKAIGRSVEEVQTALDRYGISTDQRPELPADGRSILLPYPGGRHPRIGFLDGAIDPRTDTKVTIVSPWKDREYLVVDLPEAIWWDNQLLFLAHTHIPTIWTEAGVELEPCPWVIHPDRSLTNQRTLPNGVTIRSQIVPIRHGALMEITLENQGTVPLRNLRAQVCVLLRGLQGFRDQTNDFSAFESPYALRQSKLDPDQWLVTAWEPSQRAWANPECPCLHSDPRFPDCPPGESVSARGVIAFIEAADAASAIQKVEQLNWKNKTAATTLP